MTLIADISNPRIRVYNSGNNSERYSSLLISKYSTGIQRYGVMEVKLEDLKAGEVLIVEAHIEVTTPYQTNVEVTGRLVYGTGTGEVDGLAHISEENGENVTYNEHHKVCRHTGNFVIPEDRATAYVSLAMYAAQDDHQNLQSLIIEPDYGRMIVTRISPSS